MKRRQVGFLQALALLVVSLAAGPAAYAQMATARLDELLTNLVSMAEQKCAANKNNPLVKDLKAQGKAAEAFQAEVSIHTLCVCMPSRARALLKRLPASERETRVSQDEFTRKFLPRVVNVCAGEAMKAAYAEGCAERMAPYRPNTAKYCSCMAGRFDELSEAELSQMAKENAQYMPAAAAAKQKGLPLPKRTPALDQMKAFDEACAAP
ncbi:MAG: hypothetical protein WDO72_03980 [Pseudomonadota bacterium]